MRPVILTGDSHLGALRKAVRSGYESDGLDSVRFWPLGRGGETTNQFFRVSNDKAIVETIVSGWRNRVFSKESLLIDNIEPILILSMPLNTSRILRDFSWNTHSPWAMVKRGRSIAISDSFLRDLFYEDSKYSVAFAEALQNVCDSVVVLEAPRFFRSADYLDNYPFDVCQLIDKKYREFVSGALLDKGIKIINQPKITILDDGTTDLKFDHPDPTDNHHANSEYGKIVLTEILRFAANTPHTHID